MKKVRGFFLGLIVSVAVQGFAADALTEALQKGLFEEEANQNLEAAIKAYQDVLARSEEQRRIAATALFRLAECYRKQGKTNEATAEYRRLVRDYSEQATLVNLSRQNLVGLGANNTVAASTQTQNTDSLTTEEEQQEIQRIRGLIKNSPDLINARNRTISGNTKGTVLHEAAYKGHLLVAEYLLANGADIQAMDSSKATPLYHAAGNGHKKMVELLLAKGARPSPVDAGQPLNAAVERGFQGVVEVLLAHKADVNAGRGMTALHLAIKEKNQRLAELLLANGANPNTVYAYSWSQGPALINSLGTLDGTPLHFAVQGGSPALARLLIAKGADVNALTPQGLTSLHYAQNPSLNLEIAKNLVEMLLAAGAKIDVAGKEGQLSGWTPLLIAVNHKIPQLVQLLLEKGADPNVPLRLQTGASEWALNMAVRDGSAPEIVELLLKNKADVNARDYNHDTPLLGSIVRHANRPIVDLLLDHKADMSARNAGGNTALGLAVSADNLAMAELLLSKGANANDTNVYGFPMLHVALGAQPPTAPGQPFPHRTIPAPQLQGFAQGAFPQPLRVGVPSGTSPAGPKPDKTMLQLLLENKADPNQRDRVRDKESETALHLASRQGNQAAAELLLNYKADANARTDSGITPLHRAVEARGEGLVDLLLAHNADVKAAKNDGDTALHWAAGQGLTNVVAKLVQRGADINACGANGETPLHKTIRAPVASQSHQLATVAFLLKAGADMLKRCDNRLSAFEEAAVRERTLPGGGLVDLFRKHHPKKLAAATFDGEVIRPVWFWEADKPPTLSEAIDAVGLKDTADLTRVSISRGSGGYQHNLVAIREKKTADVPLKHGDRINVAVRAD